MPTTPLCHFHRGFHHGRGVDMGRRCHDATERQSYVWTPERRVELERLWHWCQSATVIAVLLDTTPMAVAVQASRMKLSRPPTAAGARRPWRHDDRQEAIRAARAGESLLRTSQRLGRTLDGLCRQLERWIGGEKLYALIRSDPALVVPQPPRRPGAHPAGADGVSVKVDGHHLKPAGPSEPGHRSCPRCGIVRWSLDAGDRYCDTCRREIRNVA